MVAEIVGADLLVVLLVVALLFGSARLPKLARSLGGARREFEEGLTSGGDGSGAGDLVELSKAEYDELVGRAQAYSSTDGDVSASEQDTDAP